MGIYAKGEYDDKALPLVDHISRELDGADYDTGALEAAARTAENTKDAFARLVTILAEKGLLSEPEVSRVVHGYDKGLVLVDDFGGCAK